MFPAVDPVKYLEFAHEISSRPETEAKRTAADRAYYAAFLFSRDQLASKGYITPYYKEEDKRYVSQELKRLKFSIGNSENLLRRRRTTITYDTRDVEGPSLNWMLQTAEKIIDYVKALPDSSVS